MNPSEYHRIVLELRFLTMMMAKTWRQYIEQRLQAEGIELSWLQQAVLRMLHLDGALTISELSRRFMCDPSTLVPSIDGLERKGFVNRERDPRDRRRVPLQLTAEGSGFVERVELIHEDDPLLNSVQRLGVESSMQLVNLMREIVRGLPEGEQMMHQLHTRILSQLQPVTEEHSHEQSEQPEQGET